MRISLLPLASVLAPRERRWLRATTALLVALVAATGLHAAFGIGGRSVEQPIRDWVTSAVYILVGVIVCWRAVHSTEARRPWMFFAFGISVYGLGNVLWAAWIEHLPNPPIPSICDGMWLTLYPACYIGILGLARVRERRVPARIWLDGIIAGLGVAAIGAAIVVRPVLASVTGSTAAVITEMAYPICDLLLAALVVGVLALRGWRLNRMWAMLGAGFLALAAADCLYALQVAGGASAPSTATNLAYDVGVLLLALAAWQPAASVETDTVPGYRGAGDPGGVRAERARAAHLRPLQPPRPAGAGAGDAHDARRLRAHRARVPRRARARRNAPAGAHRRSHLDAQPPRLPAPHARRDRRQPGERHERGAAAVRPRPLQGAQRHARARRRRPAAVPGGRAPALACCARATRPRGWAGTSSASCCATRATRRARSSVADKILAAIAEPFPIKGVNLRVTASIGIALFPDARGRRGAADAARRRRDVRGQDHAGRDARATPASATRTRSSA